MTFHWLNESYALKEENFLQIYDPARSEYFIDGCVPAGDPPSAHLNAPFYYMEVEGDFVIRVKASFRV